MSKRYFILGPDAESYNNAAANLSIAKKDIGVTSAELAETYLKDALKNKHILEVSAKEVEELKAKGYIFYGEVESTKAVEKKESAKTEGNPAPTSNDEGTGDDSGEGDDEDGSGSSDDDDEDEDDEDAPETKTELIDWLKSNESVMAEEKEKLTKLNKDELKALYEKYKK